jgi:hypothetical protein
LNTNRAFPEGGHGFFDALAVYPPLLLTKIYAETGDPGDFDPSVMFGELIDFTLNCRSVQVDFDYTFKYSFLVTVSGNCQS